MPYTFDSSNLKKIHDILKGSDSNENRNEIEKYSHLASYDEIVKNDYNLNIPRYVDTFEEEPPIDIVALSKEMQDIDQKIAQSEAEFLSLVDDLDVNEHTQSTIDAIKAVFKHD